MITLDDMVQNLERLSVKERLTLMEKLSSSLKNTVEALDSNSVVIHSVTQVEEPTTKGVPASKVWGMARPKDGHIPTDEEVEEARFSYLWEKYK